MGTVQTVESMGDTLYWNPNTPDRFFKEIMSFNNGNLMTSNDFSCFNSWQLYPYLRTSVEAFACSS